MLEQAIPAVLASIPKALELLNSLATKAGATQAEADTFQIYKVLNDGQAALLAAH